MKIKTGCTHPRIIRINDDDVFRLGSRQNRKGKLVIWINGDKGYNGLAEVGKKFEDAGVKKSPVEHPDKLGENSHRLRQLAMA